MSRTNVMSAPRPGGSRARTRTLMLLAAACLAVGFFAAFAAPYLALDPQRFGRYWPRRGWLLLHITGGAVALLVGPAQLWLGLRGSPMRLHRRLGMLYLAGIALGALGAVGLVVTTTFGWVFGAGLAGATLAWIVTTALAFAAIRRGLVEQHKEWMIRSYVLTFAFVTFRIFFGALQAAGVGTVLERLTAASWFCWAVPLVVTEALLQGRKILAAGGRHTRAVSH